MVDMSGRENAKNITDTDVIEAINDKLSGSYTPKSKNGIVVKGIHDIAVRFSKCCSPVPGDEIVGYVTRGRGVSIHRTDCINMIHLNEIERARLIDADWENTEESGGLYLAEINIYTHNRRGVLVDVSRAFTERDVDLITVHTKVSKAGIATISLSFEVKGKNELASLIEKLRQVESVIDIERTRG